MRRVLEIRTALGKTSVAKYTTMLGAACADHRLRGILQFYGANRSGRWAGRLVQVHNLAKNFLPDLDLARRLAASASIDVVCYKKHGMVFGETPFFAALMEGISAAAETASRSTAMIRLRIFLNILISSFGSGASVSGSGI